MFGTYPQIASYIHSAHDVSVENNVLYQEPLPAYLRPSFQPRQPWIQGRGKHGLTEDFIMIAEFSELEGPKPLITIPKDGGANFDKNAFALRILAVDCQNSTEFFSVSEDAQIVLCDKNTGVFAFVHHLVLHDNTARGFVRPYCIAYITADQQKLMYLYEDLSFQFRKVARCLKYGNRMLFVGDLERHLKDLEYTKNVLLSQVSKIRLRNIEESNGQVKNVRRNAENELYKALQTIQESSTEIKKILSVVKPLLSDRKLEAHFRLLEERAFQRTSPPGQNRRILQDSWFNDLSTLDELNAKSLSGSPIEPKISSLALFKPREYKPVLVKTKKARRFNAPLRGLHELCSWGAKEGVRKLRCIHEYFRRDMTVLEFEKIESRLFYPNNASISIGQCIAGNFLTDVHMSKFDTAGERELGWSMLYSYHWGSTGSLDSLTSYKSALSCPSSFSGHQEASPSSYHTYASLGSHIFQSAPSSPEEEFSFLANHEYYLDLDNFNNDDNISEKWLDSSALSQTHESIELMNLMDKTLMSESSDCFQDRDNTLSENGDFCENNTQVLFSKASSQAITHISESEHLANVSFVKNSSVHSSQQVEDKTVNEPQTRRHYQNQHYVDNVINSKVQNENFYQESVIADGSKVTSHSGSSLEVSVLDLATQSHSAYPQNIPDNHNSLVSSTKCHTQKDVQTFVLQRNNKPVSLSDFKTVSTTHHDDQQSTIEHSGSLGVHKICKAEKAESLDLLNLENYPVHENKVNVELLSTESVHKDFLNKFKISQAAVTSSWILENGEVFTQKLSSQSASKISTELTVEGSSNNNTAAEISNLQSENQLKYSLQMTELTNSCKETSSQKANYELSYEKVRAESNASSVFSTSSVQELYPQLMDVGNGSLKMKDSERSGAAETEVDYIDVSNSYRTGVWKPRCGLYAVGDWINNLAFGRPGFGLSEALSTYQNLEHVIFSLLCGRPVLIVAPAKLEQEVIRLINSLAVFVPGAGRKCHAVLEWTSQCLKITDLIMLKLVGMCRPERRSADSFIPSAIKRVCTVIDLENRMVTAPPYQGQFITSLLSKKKSLKSDVQLLSYIEWWLMDIVGKAFLFFHIFCLSSAGSILYSHNPKDQRDAYCATVSAIMNQLGVKNHDCEIIGHLVELVKISELEPHVWHDVDAETVVQPLTLQQKTCDKFRC